VVVVELRKLVVMALLLAQQERPVVMVLRLLYLVRLQLMLEVVAVAYIMAHLRPA